MRFNDNPDAKREFMRKYKCKEAEFPCTELELVFRAFALPGVIWDHPRKFIASNGDRIVLLHCYFDQVLLRNHPRFIALVHAVSKVWNVSVRDPADCNVYWFDDETYRNCKPFAATVLCRKFGGRLGVSWRNALEFAIARMEEFETHGRLMLRNSIIRYKKRVQELDSIGFVVRAPMREVQASDNSGIMRSLSI